MCLPTNDLRFVQLPRPLRGRAGVWGKTPRHSEALAEESQGFNTPCRPEFISGPYQFSIGLQAGKMLNQVQHDIIFLSLRRGIKGEVTS